MGATFVAVISFGLLTASAVLADDVGTAFTYQGELLDAGTPVNATCDFEFTLWDAVTLGNQLGPTRTPTVTVTNGRFTEVLDFEDDKFQGSPRFLKIQVCCPTGCAVSPGYTLLALRQELTPAPYALALPALRIQPSGDVSFPDSPNVIGGHHDNSVGSPVAGATIAGGGDTGFPNSVTQNFGTVGGGGLTTPPAGLRPPSAGAQTPPGAPGRPSPAVSRTPPQAT